MSAYPPALAELIEFFEPLSEPERRENLIDLAEGARQHGPKEGVIYTISDVRRDEGCTDTVGIFILLNEQGELQFAVSLGPKVQTLTRAMGTLLCRGLSGCTPAEVLSVPEDFVVQIVGEELVRLRSRTVYYLLSRIKQAVAKLPS